MTLVMLPTISIITSIVRTLMPVHTLIHTLVQAVPIRLLVPFGGILYVLPGQKLGDISARLVYCFCLQLRALNIPKASKPSSAPKEIEQKVVSRLQGLGFRPR